MRLLQRVADHPFAVERQERLHVDHLGVDARLGEELGGLERDPAAGAVGDDGGVPSAPQHLGHAERQADLADVDRQPLLEAVAVEHLDDDAGVVAGEQGVVEGGGAGHVAGHADPDPPHQAEDPGQRRAGVPDPLQAMAAGADDHRGLLPAGGAVAQRGEIVGEDLEGVEQVVEVLDLGERPQAAQREADRLPDDRRLADAGVGHPAEAVLLLQPHEPLVDVAERPDVLPEGEELGHPGHRRVEAGVEHLVAVDRLGRRGVDGRHGAHRERRARRGGMEVGGVERPSGRGLFVVPGRERVAGRHALAAGGDQQLGGRGEQLAPLHRVVPFDDIHRGADSLAGGRGRGQIAGQGGEAAPLLAQRLLERLPGAALRGARRFLRLLFDAAQLLVPGELLREEPGAHLHEAVVLLLPGEALLRLVPFVGAGGRVPLRLRQLGDVDDRRDVLPPHPFGGLQIGLAEGRVVPAACPVEVDPVRHPLVALEAGEHLGEAALGELVLDRHRDAVAVVPDREQHRRLHHGGGVDRLPEEAFGARGVADRAEGDLVAPPREVREVGEVGPAAEDARGVAEADQTWHLRGGRGDVGGGVRQAGEVEPLAGRVEEAGGEVGVHLPPGRARLALRIRVGVELCEVLFEGEGPDREHEGLVAVVARAPVAGAEGPGHRELRDLLAVAEDPELRLAGEHLAAAEVARLPRQVPEPVVVEDRLARKLGAANAAGGFGHGGASGGGHEEPDRRFSAGGRP